MLELETIADGIEEISNWLCHHFWTRLRWYQNFLLNTNENARTKRPPMNFAEYLRLMTTIWLLDEDRYVNKAYH